MSKTRGDGDLPPSEIIPSGYRRDPVNDRLRQRLNHVCDQLGRELERTRSTDSGDDYATVEADVLDRGPWKWWGDGSERTVLGVGKTHRGERVTSDGTGVVAKITPFIRESREFSPRSLIASGNINEILTWKHAVDNGHDDLFGTILDYADDGAWLVMKEYVPIYRSRSPNHTRPTDYLRLSSFETDPLATLEEDLVQRGYDPHLKRGNAAIAPNGERDVVVIDYGSHLGIGGISSILELV